MHLDQQISELLYHYDCVIIPEFGGFITNYKPAHLDDRLHLFHPPSKEVSFNKNLTRNDGLLAQYLTEMRDCSFEEANAIIKRNVEDYFTKLNNGERIVFKKVGIIYRDANKSLRFQPSKEQNFLKDAFGLEKIFAIPAGRTEKAESAEKAKEQTVQPVKESVVVSMDVDADREQKEQSHRERNGRLAWAAVIVLPIFAYAGWVISTADLSQPKNLTIADLNPFRKHTEAIYTERAGQSAFNTEHLSDGYTGSILASDEKVVNISFTDPPGEGVSVRLHEIPTPTPPVNTYVATPEILAMRYHVVGGCFSELGNARGLVDDLRGRGYNAYILDHHKGLYRVTYGNYTSRPEAIEALRKVKNKEMEAAWLLVQ